MHLLDSGYDWDYPVEPQERGNSFMRHARAKVLGGCSSHNSCIAFWPPAEGLDDWAAMGATGWGAAGRPAAGDAVGEQRRPRRHHGHDGPVRLRDVPPNDPCGVAVLEAAAQAGMPTVAFNRGETVRNGAGWFQINAAEDGTRMSTSHAYLHPILGTRTNLEVRTDCWVSEILFDDAPAATGRAVPATRSDRLRHGVGPPRGDRHRRGDRHAEAVDALRYRADGAPARVRRPGARRLARRRLESRRSRRGTGVLGGVTPDGHRRRRSGGRSACSPRTEDGLDQPDLMMHYGSVPFDMNTLRWGYPTTDNGFCLTPNVTQGRSRGTVRLRSRDFRDRAKVDPRYFTDPEGHDERVMLAGHQAGAHHRRAGTAARAGSPGNWRPARTRSPTTSCSTTSTRRTTPSTTRRAPPGWARPTTRWRCSTPNCGSRASTRSAGRRRVGDAETACRQPEHHGDDDGREVRRPDPRDLMIRVTDEELAAYLGEHAPFQSMSPDALAELAGASSVIRYAPAR